MELGFREQVPDIYKIKQVAKRLLVDAIIKLGYNDECEYFGLSSGGFSATAYRDGSLSLSFVVEECNHFADED